MQQGSFSVFLSSQLICISVSLDSLEDPHRETQVAEFQIRYQISCLQKSYSSFGDNSASKSFKPKKFLKFIPKICVRSENITLDVIVADLLVVSDARRVIDRKGGGKQSTEPADVEDENL